MSLTYEITQSVVLSCNNFTSGPKRVIAFNKRDRERGGERERHSADTRWRKVAQIEKKETLFFHTRFRGVRSLVKQSYWFFFLFFLLFIIFRLEGLLNIGIYSRYSLDLIIVTFFFFCGSCINFLAVMMTTMIMLIAL